MQGLTAAATMLTALTAFTSLITTWYVSRLDGQRSKSDAFFRLTAVINSDDMRRKRGEVYSLNRNEFSKWTPEQRNAVDDWLACLDLSLTLYKANAINRDIYMYMFGDVTLRTVYQVVPYCNSEVDARGDQFLIPMRLAIPGVVSKWRSLARKNRFPLQLTVSRESQIKITPDSFEGDAALKSFSQLRH